jgi:hypothetical protein
MLIQSTSLDRVLIELGSDNKIKTFGCDIREALITAALPIGYLRLYSRQKGFNLRFERLNYSTCINAQSLEVDRQRLVQEVKNRSQRPELSPAELEIAMQSLESVGNDPWQICTGDDLISILSIGLRRALGTNPASTVRPEELRRSLRLAFGDNEFASSQLAGALRKWEATNPNFRILR